MDGPLPQPLPIDGLAEAVTRTERGRRAARPGAVGGAESAGGEGADAPPPPFEEAMAELERIVRELESGELGLDQSLALYERGVALVRVCAAQLDAAEARVKVLTLDETGKPVLQPLREGSA